MGNNRDAANKIIGKALSDASYKASLIKDSGKAIQAATGITVPTGVTVKVLEDTATLVHLVLPAPLSQAKGELDESQLEKVSGGAGKLTIGCSMSSDLPCQF